MTHALRVKIVVPITNLLLVVELAKNVWVDFANKYDINSMRVLLPNF